MPKPLAESYGRGAVTGDSYGTVTCSAALGQAPTVWMDVLRPAPAILLIQNWGQKGRVKRKRNRDRICHPSLPMSPARPSLPGHSFPLPTSFLLLPDPCASLFVLPQVARKGRGLQTSLWVLQQQNFCSLVINLGLYWAVIHPRSTV